MSFNNTDSELIFDYIRGKINEQTYASIQKNKPKNKLMIFVSSTFTDTIQERDTLHEIILPELQKKADKEEIQVLLYDMRFGVKDENTLDHLTWIACREAIEQCLEESDGLFFLSLQGDKYGYMPLPKYLEKEAFETALEKHEGDEGFHIMEDLALEWYVLDENYVKPQYELKGLKLLDHKGFWKNAMTALRDCLFESFPFELLSVEPKKALLVNRSVTEWETLFALEKDKKRCFWMHRLFDQHSLQAIVEKKKSARAVEFLCDRFANPSVKPKHEELIHEMESHLLPSQICRFSEVRADDYLNNSATYLKDWENAAYNLLNMEIETLIKKTLSWLNHTSLEFGLPVKYLEEIVHHNNIARSKSFDFIGREDAVQNAMDLLIQPKPTIQDGRLDVALYVAGVSGAGKTSFMSKLAIEFQSINNVDNIPVILRYCGTSNDSLHGKDLVQSISIQILCIYGQKERLHDFIGMMGEQKYEVAVNYFGSLMLEFPIYLFIDSLDQLSNRDEARWKLSFLKNVKVHEKSRIIVSTLPDEKDEETNQWKYLFFCEQRLKENNIPRIEIGALDTERKEEIQSILETLLERRGKKIKPHQWRVVLNAARIEPTMLYLNLSVEVISKWRSLEWDVILMPTVKGLIHQILDDLERQYGKFFTRYALGLITYSRDGINDIEMKDCLSLQKEVLEEIFQYSTLTTFPIHVWLRLKRALKYMIIEKKKHCIKWYHRQLWETAAERYEPIKKNCHILLGRYFTNLVETEEKREKGIQNQELTVNHCIVWLPSSKINSRRVREGYYHLIEADMIKEAVEEMCNFDFICASAIIKDGYNLVSYLGRINDKTNKEKVLAQKINDYLIWLQKEISTITTNPRIHVSNTAGEEPIASTVYKDYMRKLITSKSGNFTKSSIVWKASLHGKTKDVILSNWRDNGIVYSVAWNHKSTKIASGSGDKTIKLWDAITGEVIRTLDGHNDCVHSVKWNRDGSKIASGSGDKTIKIWDSVTGEVLHTLEGHIASVCSVSWSPDSHQIVSGSEDKSIRIWDITTGEVIRLLEGHTHRVSSVSWGPDGNKIASGSGDKTVRIWDATTGKVIKTFEGECIDAHGVLVSWNHDGSKLAGSLGTRASQKLIQIWDPVTGEKITTLTADFNYIRALSWNRDGNRVASGSDMGAIKIWDTATWEVIKTLEGHSGYVNSISWSHDSSKMSSGSKDNTIKIWDIATVEATRKAEGHNATVTSVSWSHDGKRIASGSSDKTIKIWDANTGKEIAAFDGHGDSVTSVSWNHDGCHIASGSSDKTIKIWDALTGEVKTVLEGHNDCVYSVAWNHDGSKIASGSGDKTIKIWDSATGKVIKTLAEHIDCVFSISWNHDDRMVASGSHDSTIKLWDVSTGEVMRTLEGHSDAVCSLSWNHDSSKIVSGSGDTTITIWDTATGKQLSTLQGHKIVVNSVSWNHDGSKIASRSFDWRTQIWDAATGTVIQTLKGVFATFSLPRWTVDGSTITLPSNNHPIKIWDPKAIGEVVKRFKGHNEVVSSISWNPDDSKIASGSEDKTIKVWDSTTGEVILTLEGHLEAVTSVSWNHDGSKIASGSYDKTIKIWDSITGKVIKTLKGHSYRVFSVAWNHDDSKLVSGSNDKTIKIWDAATGEMLRTLEGHKMYVNVVSWNHDGSKIVSGSGDRTIEIWDAINATMIKKLKGSFLTFSSPSWNHDGSKIASGCGITAKIWDTATGKVVTTLEGHVGEVFSVSWNYDGSKIASASQDRTIKIWDATTGRIISTLEGHLGKVSTVSWNHAGSKIASGSDDKTINIWTAIHS